MEDSLDALDEFFDFAQLEHDHGVHGGGNERYFASPDFCIQTAPMAMDWQPTNLETPDAPPALPSELYPHHALGQAPEVDYLGQLSPIETVYTQQDPTVGSSNTLLAQEIAPTPTAATSVWTTPTRDADDASNHATSPPKSLQRNGTVIHKPASARRKGPSNRIPTEARQMLEEEFASNPYPCSWEIDIIAHQANLDVKRVRNWYNNTRARKKPIGQHESYIVKFQLT